ncbi:low affinity iron permease family protein [Legionella sainthelensi]|uniref:Low affinity iron permease family protein n=1 Tax=Legionella sainthelensi TaxID=28087 RepID=A0A2H5FM93_9GAMM|nr:low affinity iron permease family protein [Legionella sainthelensi]AUH72675.1 low affinity iron permease family protein [Legionella sainthelensi]
MTKKKNNIKVLFQKFSEVVSKVTGSLWAFLTALFLIFLWVVSGPVFKFSDTWQLVINTGTTIVTFLMVFLIQHTQNRDTKIINLKLDELIKSTQDASNITLDLDELSDEELQILENKYKKMCDQISKKRSK